MLLVPELVWQYQAVIFSGLSVISIALYHRYQAQHPEETDQPALNRRGAQYLGRTFTLQEPISDRVGILRVDDTAWRITGDDLPSGTRVVVIGADGAILRVQRHAG
jgi:membrane protein implicated in regulation of membrane protease activity